MSPLLHVAGPSGSGPGERREMLERAHSALSDAGVAAEDVVRVDVPAAGAGEEGRTTLRAEIEGAVPVLQSGSLFGGRPGLLIMGAEHLSASESLALAELLRGADLEVVAVALVSAGSVAAALAKVVKERGTVETVKRVWERDAGTWLAEEVRRRDLGLDREAQGALIQRFGTDLASLDNALDQLAEVPGKVTAELVLDRFRNRPDEPIFHYTDAVAKGDVGEALRRLGDLLTHTHPLAVLATLETDLRRRALASASPDVEEFARLAGGRASDRWVKRAWGNRGRTPDSSLRSALEALVRADRTLKSAPEELHQVTMERLTVALCRWYRARR